MSTPKPRPPLSKSILNAFMFAAIFLVILNEDLRLGLGRALGTVLNPVLGFDGHFPVISIMLAGSLMVFATTLMRHFMTDWIHTARNQAKISFFNKEFMKANKEKNSFRIKKLQAVQPQIMELQREMSQKQLKAMPLTMLIVIPFFAWLGSFVLSLDYWFYAAPWNHRIDLLDKTVFPHWILLYTCLSIPLGTLIQRSMKFFSWRKRWRELHATV